MTSSMRARIGLASGRRTLILLGFVILSAACSDDVASPLQVEDAATTLPLVGSDAEIARLAETATDPYLTGLLASIPSDSDYRMLGALTAFGTEVRTSPGQSFLRFQTELNSLQAGMAAPEDSDALLALSTLELYRSWAHVTLYGVEF